MNESKRSFLKMLGALSAAGTGIATPLGMNLMSMASSSVLAAGGQEDYKAIVCLFMFGGNDSHNMVVPYDLSAYTNYYNMRSSIAIARDKLLAFNADNVTDGRQFSFHPAMIEIKQMFDAGNVAVLSNVGTLVEPSTKAQILANTAQLPPKLYSHNDQQCVWQAGAPEGSSSGYGGRMADIIKAQNSNALFTTISPFGANSFLAGKLTSQYVVSVNGAIPIAMANSSTLFGSSVGISVANDLLTANHAHMMEQDLSNVNKSSINGINILASALPKAPELPIPADAMSNLSMQMRAIAQIIASRQALGVKREVFFVGIGGFDSHDDQIVNQNKNLSIISKSMAYFYNATAALGLDKNITTFTASDFGRTLASNGDGSDHGWGAHHLMMGGAVRGRNIFGKWPVLAMNGPDDMGSGRLIPSTAVEQYLATLATWIGIPDSGLVDIFPNLKNFGVKNLGFML
jgi:uncharacterized protein (DUF1501 family)